SEACTMPSKVQAQRIIDNTITNAIKYRPKDIESIVKLDLEDERINLSVHDFGKGKKDVKKVWKRYVREDEIQGVFGLGLNIVSEICQKHDILYGVDSVYHA
ncbi:ATP-binding protein, partial [Campylobacter concisus]|uniref:ATP-binding protein n=1 Tax=Campylobacter concisus TaxID=199 RepID=UPI00112FB69B